LLRLLMILAALSFAAPVARAQETATESETETETETETEAETEAEAPFLYRGIAVHLGIFTGGTPARDSYTLGARLTLTVPLTDFMRFEATGASFGSSKGNQDDEYAAAILHAGVRLAPWRIGETVEPYLSIRFCHMHEATRTAWARRTRVSAIAPAPRSSSASTRR
jgi:hypothetical protein